MKSIVMRAASLSLGAVVLAGSLLAVGPAGAGTDPVASSVSGLEAKVSPKGIVKTTAGAPDPSGTANWSATAETLVSLGLNGGNAAVVAKMATALSTHLDVAARSELAPGFLADDAGKLAELSLAALASKRVNPLSNPLKPKALIGRLVATQRSSGLFGQADPTYDGVLRQGLSLLVINLSYSSAQYSGKVVKAANWLVKQQCPDGGFPSLKKAPGPGCTSDPASYLGPDTNSTAMAIVGLISAGAPSGPADPLGKAISWLESQELSSAGWGWYPTNDADASSTAFAILALGSVGRDPSSTTGPLSRSGISPLDALSTFADPSGGFYWQPGSPADLISTNEALFVIGATRT